MKNKTDLQVIKDNVSIPFLHLKIETEKMGLIVWHPYLESSAIMLKKDLDGENIPSNYMFVDVVQDKKAYNHWILYMKKRIKDATTLNELYSIVRKSYRLTFLKYAKEYMSQIDFSHYLADAWVSSENPNQDANCDLKTLVKWFRQCDKTALMQPEDYAVYNNLPDELRVYRGVAVNREPNGLSWTSDINNANWFAHRFDRENKKGYIQTAIANKSDILAYFNTRDEDELVVDSSKLKIERLNDKYGV